MMRRTVVVDGPLAFRTRRIEAARMGECGVQILSLQLLAGRLAGGFSRAVRPQELYPAIRAVLEHGGFHELESIRLLPGTTRSVAGTLESIWNSGADLRELTSRHKRLAEIAELDARTRSQFPIGVFSPPDLRDLALARISHAPAILGPIELDRLTYVAPVWRSLLNSLTEAVEVTWRNPGTTDVDWFSGHVVKCQEASANAPSLFSCANPRAEVIEALRWMRELIASGCAHPAQIAICATKTVEWDEHFLVLAAETDLPIHFSHGLPVLASREGQSCAALADILLHGLSQNRIRRLFGFASGHSRGLAALPADWSLGLKPGAALFELDQWRRALDGIISLRTDGIDPRPLVMPILELLVKGPQIADEVGSLLLTTAARPIWTEALRRAPAEALEYTLQDLRLPDKRDPGASAVWCPASHLAGSPRPWVRMLGMNSRSWPRQATEDPLIPPHILPSHVFNPDSVTEQDRRSFVVITGNATSGCVLSLSRRNAQGGRIAASSFIEPGRPAEVLKRSRVPRHAFSEADRLLARPDEASSSSTLAAADLCWRNWRRSAITPHDGQVRTDHPQIARAVGMTQSATSLRLMLRDPLAFIWHYALGWRTVPDDEQPLALDARAYGELVHELLKRAVDMLEPNPGYARASRQQIELALNASSDVISSLWPLNRSVPPALLWQHTLANAVRLALKALTLDEITQSATRSWAEVGFGGAEDCDRTADLPWPPDAKVEILGTGVHIRGSIDRLDLTGDGRGARVSDYKTGLAPRQAEDLVLGGATELQRVIYATAARQLLPQNPRVIARLIFLGSDKPECYRLQNVDRAVAELGKYVSEALTLLRKGSALPGPDANEDDNEYRIALPAWPTTYLQRKNVALMRSFGEFTRTWSSR